VWTSFLFQSYNSFPPDFEKTLLHLYEVIERTSAARQNLDSNKEDKGQHLLRVFGSFLLLRFICPAIVSPVHFRIAQQEDINTHAQRTLVLMSKLVHCIAHKTEVSSEEHMKPANQFVEEIFPELLSFLTLVVDRERDRTVKNIIKCMSPEDKMQQASTQHKEVKKQKEEKKREASAVLASEDLFKGGFL